MTIYGIYLTIIGNACLLFFYFKHLYGGPLGNPWYGLMLNPCALCIGVAYYAMMGGLRWSAGFIRLMIVTTDKVYG